MSDVIYPIYSYIGHTFDTMKLLSKVLYTGQTKRVGNIWHNLGGNTIILFYNINNEYMNNKLIRCAFAVVFRSQT